MANHVEGAVLDASVAAKWYLLDEPFVIECKVLFDQYRAKSLQFIAPLHILYEVPSAIMVASRTRPPRLPEHQALAAIRDFIDLAVPTVHDDALVAEATSLAYQYGCAFYDGLVRPGIGCSQRTRGTTG